MAVLGIREYKGVAHDARGNAVAAPDEGSLVTTQTVTISGSSTQSSAVGATTRFVLIIAGATCNVATGADPTASVGGAGRLATSQMLFLGVIPGSTKIAVISDT